MRTAEEQRGEEIATWLSKGSGRERLRSFPCTEPHPESTLHHRPDHPSPGRDGCLLLSLTVRK